MARRAAWLRSERPRRRLQLRRPQRRRSAEKRRRSLAPAYSLRLRRTSMTASKGPAQVDQRTAQCDRFRLAGSDGRQGRRRDRESRHHPSCAARLGRMKRRHGPDPGLTVASICHRACASGISPTPSGFRARPGRDPKSSFGAASSRGTGGICVGGPAP
jgi:hypothetical protein